MISSKRVYVDEIEGLLDPEDEGVDRLNFFNYAEGFKPTGEQREFKSCLNDFSFFIGI